MCVLMRRSLLVELVIKIIADITRLLSKDFSKAKQRSSVKEVILKIRCRRVCDSIFTCWNE